MSHLPDELRLVIAIAVNVFVFIAAFRFVRRITSQDRIGATLDALLIHYLVQYLSVCLTGLLGILSAESTLSVALLLGTTLLLQPRRAGFSPHVPLTTPTDLSPFDRLVFLSSLFFVLGYFLVLIYTLSSGALVGDDALTYHLPVAGYWLQTHHLGLYNTWFFNPANTYSPLAGSTFLAWLIAPIGCDELAGFAQMPAMILVFFAIVQIARSMGARVSVASLAAAGALLSRPFVGEVILVKDDQFLSAFFLAAIAGCAPERVRDRFGPWRIGIALGLFFATKYTALLTAPLLLLVIDAPFRAVDPGACARRANWWLIAISCIVVTAGPWYARNWVLTGNPIYPVPVSIGGVEICKGMFIPERSTDMRTVAGAWDALTHGFHSPSPALVIVLLVLWLLALVIRAKSLTREPLSRVCLIGSILGLAIFFLASHAALIRYAYPSLLLLFICTPLAVKNKGDTTLYFKIKGRVPFIFGVPFSFILGIAFTGIVAAISIWGGFESKELLSGFVMGGGIVTAIGLFVVLVIVPRWKLAWVRIPIVSLAIMLSGAWIFVYWHAIIPASRQTWIQSLQIPYPDKFQMWQFINDPDHIAPDAPIAYTNLVFTRPLMGFDYSRPVFYIPTGRDVRKYSDLPSSRTRVTDQEIRGFVANLLTQNPDHDQWLANLLKSDAQYLLVGKQAILVNPPERAFADDDAKHFVRIRDDESGTLYEIRR